MSLEKTIYIGAFIQCATLTELDICENGMIGVDETGKIAFVLRESRGRKFPDGEGWEEAKIVRILDYGFFFPGFIGKISSRRQKNFWSIGQRLIVVLRHTHPRPPIPQRRPLRQNHPPRLAKHLHLPPRMLLLLPGSRPPHLQPRRRSDPLSRDNDSVLLRY